MIHDPALGFGIRARLMVDRATRGAAWSTPRMARFAVGPPRALPARVDQVSSVLPRFVTIVVKPCRATAWPRHPERRVEPKLRGEPEGAACTNRKGVWARRCQRTGAWLFSVLPGSEGYDTAFPTPRAALRAGSRLGACAVGVARRRLLAPPTAMNSQAFGLETPGIPDGPFFHTRARRFTPETPLIAGVWSDRD